MSRTNVCIIVLLASLMAVCLPSKAAEPILLHVDFADGKQQTYQLPQDIRLADTLSRLTDTETVDWAATRLGAKQLDYQLQRLLLKAKQQLNAIADFANKEQNAQLALAARQIKAQLDNSQFRASYYMGIPWNGMRLTIANNPKIADRAGSREFTLSVNERPQTVDVFGATNSPGQLRLKPADSDNSVQKLLKQQSLSDAATKDYVWRINLNGGVVYQPVASYNQHKLASCYSHSRQQPLTLVAERDCDAPEQLTGGEVILIGLNETELPEKLTGINQLLAQILKHYAVSGRND